MKDYKTMKLIVVSNRLPLTVSRTENGFAYKPSSGGLVTGLKSIKDRIMFKWIGNLGDLELTDEEQNRISKDCWEQFHSVPIFLDPALNTASYSGFCNAIMWPILHSFTDDVCFVTKNWLAYKKYNEIFCERICEVAEDNDIIWVHDYHLMLLPEMLKRRKPNSKVMFYLHVPFCKPDVFENLTCRKDILSGIAASDLIGFHSYEYALNFDECYQRFMHCNENKASTGSTAIEKSDIEEANSKLNGNGIIEEMTLNSFTQSKINYDETLFKSILSKIEVIPIGIDPELFRLSLQKETTQKRIREIKSQFGTKKILLGVDRTDYIKGMPQRMKGFKRFLSKYDIDTVYLQISVPSRTDITEYSKYIEALNMLSGEVNSSFGRVTDTYVYLLNQSIDFDELCALYAVSDVCLVTSLRDGMNLVAMEYVATQDENNGVLLLSEFAGASTTLPGAIEINSWNTEEIADGIYMALCMSEKERKMRHRVNKRNVELFTSFRWAENNLDHLCDDWRDKLKSTISE